MATIVRSATAGILDGNGLPLKASAKDAPDPSAATTAAIALAPSTTALAAAVAALVADGASPTQGHVNTLNTAYGTFATALTAYNTAVSALSSDFGADVLVMVNTTNVSRRNTLQVLLLELQKSIQLAR